MDNSTNSALRRKKRVTGIKRAIIIVAVIMILLPTILCVILFLRITQLENKLNNLVSYSQNAYLESQKSGLAEDGLGGEEGKDGALNNENVDNHEYVQRQEDYPSDVKRVYLTFDDGPSNNTDAILDILAQYNLKATFFVIMKTDKKSIEQYNRIVKEGHTLALHSTSHVYSQIYSSMELYIDDVLELRTYLQSVTGYLPTIYRFPGGSSNTVSKVNIKDCIDFLESKKITYYDWNVASGDATSRWVSSEAIVANVIAGVQNNDNSFVLMHDANNKTSTVEALPSMLQQLTDMGVLVLPITDKTTPVHHKIN